jgi:hypothetical protein
LSQRNPVVDQHRARTESGADGRVVRRRINRRDAFSRKISVLFVEPADRNCWRISNSVHQSRFSCSILFFLCDLQSKLLSPNRRCRFDGSGARTSLWQKATVRSEEVGKWPFRHQTHSSYDAAAGAAGGIASALPAPPLSMNKFTYIQITNCSKHRASFPPKYPPLTASASDPFVSCTSTHQTSARIA